MGAESWCPCKCACRTQILDRAGQRLEIAEELPTAQAASSLAAAILLQSLQPAQVDRPAASPDMPPIVHSQALESWRWLCSGQSRQADAGCVEQALQLYLDARLVHIKAAAQALGSSASLEAVQRLLVRTAWQSQVRMQHCLELLWEGCKAQQAASTPCNALVEAEAVHQRPLAGN